jgi:putative intracellular protease/amidase
MVSGEQVPKKAVYLFVFPGFADWEAAHAVAELRRHGDYSVEAVGLNMNPVESMGGIMIKPSRTLAQIDPDDVAIFILPGGDRWEQNQPEPELIALLNTFDIRQVPIAAICAATTFVVRAGLLRSRQHTSNGLAYLRQQVPDYKDAHNYVNAPAVRDHGLITASGLSDVEFAREIMAELDVLTEEGRYRWAQLFRSGRIPDDE